jgi:hypothetical protein
MCQTYFQRMIFVHKMYKPMNEQTLHDFHYYFITCEICNEGIKSMLHFIHHAFDKHDWLMESNAMISKQIRQPLIA